MEFGASDPWGPQSDPGCLNSYESSVFFVVAIRRACCLCREYERSSVTSTCVVFPFHESLQVGAAGDL